MTEIELKRLAEIQTIERSECSALSLEELATRIEEYRQASAELVFRIRVSREILTTRLAAKESEELEGLISRIPAAETMLRARAARPKALTDVELALRKAKKADPKFAALLASVKDRASKK
jgi:hypothetical protein